MIVSGLGAYLSEPAKMLWTWTEERGKKLLKKRQLAKFEQNPSHSKDGNSSDCKICASALVPSCGSWNNWITLNCWTCESGWNWLDLLKVWCSWGLELVMFAVCNAAETVLRGLVCRMFGENIHPQKLQYSKFANLLFWPIATEKKLVANRFVQFRSVKLTAGILTLMVPTWLGTSSGQPTRSGEFVFQAISERAYVAGIGRSMEDAQLSRFQMLWSAKAKKWEKWLKKRSELLVLFLFMSLPCCCTMARICLHWQSLAT